MSWIDSDHLVIDTETTGLDIGTAEIVEFGAVVFRRGEPGARRSRLIRPGRPIPAEATAVHGITDADVAEAPSLAEVAPGLLATVRRYPVVVSYNGAGYDWPLLRRLLGPAWDEATADALMVDPLPWVWGNRERRYWRGKGRHSLAEVGRRLGLPEEEAHRAVGDCLTCGRVLWAIRDELPPDVAGVRAGQARLREERAADWLGFAARNRATAVAAAYAATEGVTGLPPGSGGGGPELYWRAVAVVLGEAGNPAAEVAEEAALKLETEADARRQWDEARETSRTLLTGGQDGGTLPP